VNVWTTFREYLAHGVHHILTGYDHLLFVAALVLAARKLWDLVWVVSAFTIAHTITLTLSVCFKGFELSEHVVEPMIAASIVFVALQNVIAPRTSRGPVRLAVAFGFGLFHGLGFAGGLKEAMAEMPGTALGAALGGFSVGVEMGHQAVVLPLFAVLFTIRRISTRNVPVADVAPTAEYPVATAPLGYATGVARPRPSLSDLILRVGSGAISVAGVYFLIQAVR
jgi:hypothetical protein